MAIVQLDVPAQPAPIAPLLDQFGFAEDRTRWGDKFRFGLLKVSDHNRTLISRAMLVGLTSLQFK